jgi:DNA-binding MarR family transcriptional regulator
MRGSTVNLTRVDVDRAAVVDMLAREMVVALDKILARLMAVAPSEGGGEALLTLQEAAAAKAIPSSGAVSMSVLASSMGIALPTATHLMDRLVAKGIAVRTRAEHDRRLVLVALSEQTRAHRRKFFENRVALIGNILEPLGPMEAERVVNALHEVARVMQSGWLTRGDVNKFDESGHSSPHPAEW